MDVRIADPSQWADLHGAIVFYGIMAAIVIGTLLKLLSGRWEDWLDERSGRGSVRDWWLFNEIERRGRRPGRA